MSEAQRQGGVLIAGVGGQGVVLASAIVADAALRAGYDVKQSEVHGMSQRGGIVTSHLRYGPQVHSPLIEAGLADALVAFEWNEGLRWLPHLRPGAPLVVNLQRLVPPGACQDRLAGQAPYPPLALASLAELVGDVRACDAAGLAARSGSPKAVNSVLLGVLSPLLPFPIRAWHEALEAHVPRGSYPANQRAFEAGRTLRFPEETRRLAASLQVSANGHVGSVRPRPPRLEVIESWCKGATCGICVRVCPQYCLSIGPRDRVAVARPDACTGCRLCELLCPDFAILVHDTWGAPGAEAVEATQAGHAAPPAGLAATSGGRDAR